MSAAESVPSNINVLADAQLTNVKVLKPFAGFEAVYQGKLASTPIAFPGDLDPQAGRPGFDRHLMRGIPVPEGARVLLWIPQCTGAQDGFQEYIYRVVWRFSTLRKYRSPGRADIPRGPYHIPVQLPGAPDTTVGSQPRVIVPAAWRNVAFEQPEAPMTNGRVNLRPEEIAIVEPSLLDAARPLLADGSDGIIQQGVLDPATNPASAPQPLFEPFWFDAEGDELLILANRRTFGDLTHPFWDFKSAGVDFPFSNIYGTGDGAHASFPGVGIYIQTGANP